MSKKQSASDNKILLEEYLNGLIQVIPLRSRKLLSGLTEQIIDRFDLNYNIEDFLTDQRIGSTSTGRKPSKYFIRNQITGEYKITSTKEIAEMLGLTPTAVYVSIRRAKDKGAPYVFKNHNGIQYRINECNNEDDINLSIKQAEYLKKEYEEYLGHKKKNQYTNEDGSY